MSEPEEPKANWLSPPPLSLADFEALRMAYYQQRRIQRLRWVPDEEIGQVYDHVLICHHQGEYDYSQGGWKRADRRMICFCSCGWKSSGESAIARGEAHLRKLREWLAAHPEEEVMAGLGGKVTWPKRPPSAKQKKWKTRNKGKTSR